MTTTARCPESALCAQARIVLPRAQPRVFDCLRNLGCLADWWPGARAIVALPPGVYAAGDVAVLELAKNERIGLRVIAYKPGRRIVIGFVHERRRLLVDLRVGGDLDSATVTLSIETPRPASLLAQTLQGLRLRRLCRQAAQALERHLLASPTVAGPALAPLEESRHAP
jgi:hypothetical protein